MFILRLIYFIIQKNETKIIWRVEYSAVHMYYVYTESLSKQQQKQLFIY